MANKMSEKKKSASQSEVEEPKVRESKSARASVREERQSKPVRREAPKPVAAPAKKSGGIRNNAAVRFVMESYRELRYKVTWPTWHEAWNMTIICILLSAAVGVLLGAVDFGLLQLFKLITGR